ncbi:MAG: SBBP repeat-containing protein, partial [Dehalococcoidia bacterium]|nr:SBBP repeat-containing protein [Dehalococcoidia bacterium]
METPKKRRIKIGILIAGIVIVLLGSAGWGCSRTLVNEDADLVMEGPVRQSWVQRYKGDYSGEGDYSGARCVVVADDGSVYVAGKDATEGTGNYSYGSDYVTIKYDTKGHKVWSARYDGANDDEATAIALDQSGNVYVTGTSGDDCLTIKYDASGGQQWTARQDGASPVAIVLDSSGNPHIAAASGGNYLTIKYDSSGSQMWIARYDGKAGSDEPKDIAIDDAGNVYVTGKSKGTKSDQDTDYATIKYDSSGIEQWVQRYNGPANHVDTANEVAVDKSGNVYVSGYLIGMGESNDSGYATVKYDKTGNQKWITLYEEGEGGIAGMAIDDDGNIYVVGSGEWAYDCLLYTSDAADEFR